MRLEGGHTQIDTDFDRLVLSEMEDGMVHAISIPGTGAAVPETALTNEQLEGIQSYFTSQE